MRESKQKKFGKKKTYVSLVLLLLVVCSVSACKKEKQEDENVQNAGTPTVGVEWQGFDRANQSLVKQRAEANEATTAVTVGNVPVSMQTAMFLIYSMEVQGNSYAAYYEAQYGTDYWEMPYDEEGRTTREVFKDETINALIQYAVLYDCAKKNGMELTEEELQECHSFVEDLKEMMSAEETERGGFTEKNLKETCEWMMLAEKYYTRMTENLGITKESVRETINKEDYKEYETEYLYLATTYYDEEYNICEESEEVIGARRAQMQEYYEQVTEGVSFESLAAKDSTLVHNTRTFVDGGDGAEKAYKMAAKKLEKGNVSGPVQTEYGIYLIRMVDDECTKTYEATVEAEYEIQCGKAFQAAYEVLLAEYDVAVNTEAWDDILLGATVSLLE
ncbi:MAG: peptidylprolyl isomerase [Lachnospiraceae bacterium]|nr:peptidylprolyl isomerase [Lachnospiraceae bacterium]